MKKILPNIHWLNLGAVNAYLIDIGPLILIDTGYKGSEEKIIKYIESIGRSISEVDHILVTHHHPDHAGSLAALKERSNAKVIMHPDDAKLTDKGIGMRTDIHAAPGLLNYFIFNFFIKRTPTEYPATRVDQLVREGEILELGKGFQVIELPGHSAGQIALLYQDYGGFLFAADVAVNIMGLGYPPLFEDTEQGKKDLQRVADLHFEGAAFGHGKPILKRASQQFRKKYSN